MLHLLAAVILLMCWPSWATAQPAECPADCRCLPRSIEVYGEGEVALSPNVGVAELSVDATAAAAADALTRVAEATNRVLTALRPKMTEADRLTTEAYDLFPLYEHAERGAGTLTGYRSRATLHLEVAGTDRLGQLLDTATKAGATGISEVSFRNPGAPEARKEAAATALRDAHAMAERLAAAAGVRLGALLNVSVQPSGEEFPPPFRLRAAGATGTAPPIEPGELKVRARVSASYAMEPAPER
ncbi:MAG: SIMPL domain-containing protein [Pseudomonadota bacterium]